MAILLANCTDYGLGHGASTRRCEKTLDSDHRIFIQFIA